LGKTKTMKNLLLTLFCVVLSLASFAQNYSGPESVEYDFTNNRWLIGNKNSNQVLARDGAGNLTVLIPQSSIGNTGPYGIEIVDDVLYACCGSRVKGFDLTTLEEVFNVNTGGTFLNGITHDNAGNLIVTDFTAKVIYKLNIAAETAASIASNLVQSPNGIIFDEANNRCVFVNWGTNAPIKAISLTDNAVTTITTTAFTNCDGIAVDGDGNYYISVWGGQQTVKYSNDFSASPVQVVAGLSSPADMYFNIPDLVLGIPNSGNNTVTFVQFVLNLPEITSSSVRIYPNPASAQLFIELNENTATPQLISLYDASGKWVQSLGNEAFSFDQGKITINCESIPAGAYWMHLHGHENTEMIRVMIQK
jgi:hypothetical protein